MSVFTIGLLWQPLPAVAALVLCHYYNYFCYFWGNTRNRLELIDSSSSFLFSCLVSSYAFLFCFFSFPSFPFCFFSLACSSNFNYSQLEPVEQTMPSWRLRAPVSGQPLPNATRQWENNGRLDLDSSCSILLLGPRCVCLRCWSPLSVCPVCADINRWLANGAGRLLDAASTW